MGDSKDTISSVLQDEGTQFANLMEMLHEMLLRTKYVNDRINVIESAFGIGYIEDLDHHETGVYTGF